LLPNLSKREYRVGGQSFEGDDELIDLLFGFALAQWETKCLDRDVLQAVEAIVDSGGDLDRWGEPNSDMVKERSIVLKDFLAQISVERPKAKRRYKGASRIFPKLKSHASSHQMGRRNSESL
jgi:hypothetical protein